MVAMKTKESPSKKLPKYIFVTGGVVSGLGKGITAASLGRLLINRGVKVNIQKLDPYLNFDPGTMSPYQHGEVFVTDDGAETDLDLGHYERFTGRHLTKSSSYTMAKVYNDVISRERRGDYLGQTVQVVPHVTNQIKDLMKSIANGSDVVIIEVGGTVGEIEGMTYIEAIRQFRRELGPQGSLSIHVTLVPYLESSGEIKTKPTQNSVRDLNQMGITADIVVCRTNKGIEIDREAREKIALFCNLDSIDQVIHNMDCSSIYEVPLVLKEQGFDDIVLAKLGMKAPKSDMKDWQAMVDKIKANNKFPKTIAIVGKYVAVSDSYISVTEAVKAAALANDVSVTIRLVDAEEIEKQGAKSLLKNVDGIIVPGGFGDRGIEGKIATAKFARENKIPYLGICLGMQIAVIEFALNVAGIKGATSTEFDPKAKEPVIDIMEEQKMITTKGATMRLGLYDCAIAPSTHSAQQYGTSVIQERHRHRFEFNNKYRDRLVGAGLVIAGINEESDLVEIIELKDHPYFVAAQFHPEFLSKPYAPHPLFNGLIKACKN